MISTARNCSFWLLPVAILLALALAIPSAMAQDSPRELRQNAYAKMQQGAFADAIPDFEQLIVYLGDSEVASIKQQMEMVYYSLALCHFFVGQFEEAEKGFDTYLKKYRSGAKSRQAAIYIADTFRFRNKLKDAVKAYHAALRKYPYGRSEKADIYSSIARCHLAEDNWSDAIDPLSRVYVMAGDFLRRNWAATLLTTAYFKQLDIEKVYPLVPFILRRDSFASRSVAFNLSALEAAEELFAEERYRDALWIFRLVYPHDLVTLRSQEYLEWLQRQAEVVKRTPGDPRRLMQVQESIAETEEEIKALESTENYDLELFYRIARGYMEALRYWEGREIFMHLHDVGDAELAEESLFLAFQCSTQLLPWDRAYAVGDQYMEEYPGGEFFDMLTLSVGQLHAKEEDWPKVISHLKKALEISPNHSSGAECMFLIGYASFMEEKFDDAIEWLGKMCSRYPESDLVAAGTYWVAMSHLFKADYKAAAPEFDRLLENYPTSIYVEDGAFRRSVCAYGMSEFDDAEERLRVFIRLYPESKLLAESTMMLGDIAGALGRLDDAVREYQLAMGMPEEQLNIELYNHCAFQAGRILVEDEQYARLKEHFQRYIATAREGSNNPQAVYWIGIALWNTGEQDGAIRYYREAVEEYGKDRTAVGIDMILDEWIGRGRRVTKEQATTAWEDLRKALARAVANKEKALELRLKRVLLFDPHIKPSEKQTSENELLSTASLPDASPAVLQYMLDLAKEKGRMDFAVEVANHIIQTFTETDYALDARMILADFAIEQAHAAKNAQDKEKYYEEAIKHLGVVREVFAASGAAGEALTLLGKLFMEQEKYKEADECYTSVLGVKGWRNFWPEALYGRGECAFYGRQYEVASAYYERIYVMYTHYANWAAKAYLRRAESLRKAFQNDKAHATLQEMMTIEDLKAFPEYDQAKQMLQKM